MSNPTFYEDYKKFMQVLLDLEYAEKVPNSEISRKDNKVWYLPHHGIYHPNKPKKIRVVFDCSAKFNNTSINDVLLQGPDLTNRLLSVLLRFRQESIAILGDIEKMFYQVKVAKDDRDCLRYYWWSNGDLNMNPAIYRMTVHIFGAVSSPSCASFALRTTIQENQHKFPPSVSLAGLANFYVDDFLASVPSESEAVHLIEGISLICKSGGFRVTKWLTNNRKVLASIPEEERAPSIANLDFDEFPTDHALGILWEVETDRFMYQIKNKSKTATRRNILAVIGSVYDPFGLVSPFILPARHLLQDLCRKHVGWDEEISKSDAKLWQQWLNNLTDLKNITVPRSMRPLNFKAKHIQLHHFADASNVGYGTATYIRFISEKGEFHSQLIFAKSKVAPMKKVTIPRMELTAATLAVKVDKMMRSELQYQIDESFFWTDSMAVIRYVQNVSTRF